MEEGKDREEGGDQSSSPFLPSSSSPSPPCLDAKILEDLREIEALDEVIDIYLETAPELLQSIEITITDGDTLALRPAAHSLKSISGTLGAFILYELCQKLENMARAGIDKGTPLPREAVVIFQQVEAEYERVKYALQIEKQQN